MTETKIKTDIDLTWLILSIIILIGGWLGVGIPAWVIWLAWVLLIGNIVVYAIMLIVLLVAN